jgi:hypothetical protein
MLQLRCRLSRKLLGPTIAARAMHVLVNFIRIAVLSARGDLHKGLGKCSAVSFVRPLSLQNSAMPAL